MRHPSNTRIIFADSQEEAVAMYKQMDIKLKDPGALIECHKVTEDEEFDLEADFNLIGEISVGPPVMENIRQDPPRAYVLYYMEDVTPN